VQQLCLSRDLVIAVRFVPFFFKTRNCDWGTISPMWRIQDSIIPCHFIDGKFSSSNATLNDCTLSNIFWKIVCLCKCFKMKKVLSQWRMILPMVSQMTNSSIKWRGSF
jgi:hypothetical protein